MMCANCNSTTPTLDELRTHAKEVHQQDLDDVGEEIIKSGKNLIIRVSDLEIFQILSEEIYIKVVYGGDTMLLFN